jgi:hypothetical protein
MFVLLIQPPINGVTVAGSRWDQQSAVFKSKRKQSRCLPLKRKSMVRYDVMTHEQLVSARAPIDTCYEVGGTDALGEIIYMRAGVDHKMLEILFRLHSNEHSSR